MKRCLFTMFFAIWAVTATMAQEYQVKSLKQDVKDQSAVNSPRKDLIGNDCALVKLIAGDKVVQVEGNVIGDVQRKGAVSAKLVYHN